MFIKCVGARAQSRIPRLIAERQVFRFGKR
jgi:hypothetical protein